MTSSPGYAQSNGFIERQVHYIKAIIKNCLNANSDIYKALLNARATLLDSTLPSPALSWCLEDPYQLLFQVIPVRWLLNTIRNMSCSGVTTVLFTPDHFHRYWLENLLVFWKKQSKTWFPGTITAQNKDRSYQILTEAGRSIICNRQHLGDLTPPNDAPTCTSTIPVDPPNSNGNTIINSAPTATLCQPITTMVDGSPRAGAETRNPVTETGKGVGQSP